MLSVIEFKEWPKTPRLNREMIVTEKIDGTNAAIIIVDLNFNEDGTPVGVRAADGMYVGDDGYPKHPEDNDGTGLPGVVTTGGLAVAAQSRKRLISPGKQTDNAGFAGWVRDNAQALAGALGPGYHYGEWWGKGVQTGYGLDHKRFSLFNVNRYADAVDSGDLPDNVDLVPVLYDGPFSQHKIEETIQFLRDFGSQVYNRHHEVPPASRSEAEGVVIFHKAAGHVYKVLCENDELPKGIVPRQEREALDAV